MRHRNYWRSLQIGNSSRCQISTITCLTSSTMRAACTLLCRLDLDAQEVRSLYTQCKYSTMVTPLIYEAFFSRICMLILHKYSKTSWDSHYNRDRVKSQQVFCWWQVHNKYSLWTEVYSNIFWGTFKKNNYSECTVQFPISFASCVSCLFVWLNKNLILFYFLYPNMFFWYVLAFGVFRRFSCFFSSLF